MTYYISNKMFLNFGRYENYKERHRRLTNRKPLPMSFVLYSFIGVTEITFERFKNDNYYFRRLLPSEDVCLQIITRTFFSAIYEFYMDRLTKCRYLKTKAPSAVKYRDTYYLLTNTRLLDDKTSRR